MGNQSAHVLNKSLKKEKVQNPYFHSIYLHKAITTTDNSVRPPSHPDSIMQDFYVHFSSLKDPSQSRLEINFSMVSLLQLFYFSYLTLSNEN